MRMNNFLPPTSPHRRTDGLHVAFDRATRRVKEYLFFDCRVFHRVSAYIGLAVGLALMTCGRRQRGLATLASIHRANWSSSADTVVEHIVRREVRRSAGGESRVKSSLADYVDTYPSSAATRRFFEVPERLLGHGLFVLKSPARNEKGILAVHYSFMFPVLAKFFDLRRVAERYHIVLEPSWSGYCDLNILCYADLSAPVFVQAFEPRDAQFVASVRKNLVTVPTSTNWWVDHRIHRPLPGVPKEFDVIMLAAWAHFKRHVPFFSRLAEIRRRGRKLKVALVGYQSDCTARDLAREAEYHGVLDQLQFFENLTPEEVNVKLNQAKVNVIWSRKEGVNRAIVEGMLANVPCVVREGFNYGYRYPYVNDLTGRFASEASLPNTLVQLVDSYETFAPREWVMEYMSCQKATEIAGATVRRVALDAGEAWTTEPVVKVGHLNGMRYWDDADRARFENDYRYLASLRTAS
jgi:glycosyltransferase involved in cell wall biosynthesis